MSPIPSDPRGGMSTFTLAELFGLLSIRPPILLFREHGECALPVLEEQLLAVSEPGTLVLDGDAITLMDASFVDASIIELAFRLDQGRYGDRFLVLINVSEGTKINLASAIAYRRQYKKQEIVVLVREGKELLPLGDMERNLFETWQLVRDTGTVTARGLADELRLEISAAGMRLKRLYDARLLTRRDGTLVGGRQLVYSVPAYGA